MSVKIRMTRIGRNKEAIYRIVVADSRFARDARYIEQIGFYNPANGEKSADINEEAAIKWLLRGAQPSDSIRTLFTEKGIIAKYLSAKKGK